MYWDELWWAIGLFVAVTITAALVNRVRPQHKSRIRRLVVNYALFVVAVGVQIGFQAIDLPTWASTLAVIAELLKSYILVTLAATLVFTVIMPSLSVELPMIASDLIVGLGIVAATLVVLARNGMNPTNALVSGAVVSAVLAISLQSTLGNILGGVALQLDGSIQEGDWIQFDNSRVGRVRAVRWRHTVVETREFSTIIVPNAQLLAQSITILGKRDGVPQPQRIGVTFNIDARFLPSRVTSLVAEALQGSSIENVADEPPPMCACVDLANNLREGTVSYIARYSIIDLATEEQTSSRVRARVFAALKRADIQPALPVAIAFADQSQETIDRRTASDVVERLGVMRQIPLFQTFNEDELRTLAGGLKRAIYAQGETVFRQGTDARELFILASGRVEIRTNVDPDGPGGEPERPIFVAEVSAPSYFGERGLMTGEPRSAEVIVTEDAEMFRIDKETFQKVLLARPEIVQELSERLAKRRVELEAARGDHDPAASAARQRSEGERLRRAIQSFFGL
jgi:CRP-like cAMP-binding protein/small-conductance mechanosensitive channel